MRVEAGTGEGEKKKAVKFSEKLFLAPPQVCLSASAAASSAFLAEVHGTELMVQEERTQKASPDGFVLG
jgi:hypothetical protein